MKTEAIRVGDQFKMRSGSLWKVIRTRPGGVVELFNKTECRFVDCYHHEVSKWERVSRQESHG